MANGTAAPGLVAQVEEYRMDIDPEYQGWVLMFATVSAIWLFCLPCYCAGLSHTAARRFASYVSRYVRLFYVFMTLFNLAFIYIIILWLPDWTMSSYMKVVVKTLARTLANLLKFATSIAMIVAFCIVVAFKDRLAQLLGIDHQMLFKCKLRDCLSCWSTGRLRPVEVSIWKVEDLPAGDMFVPNNVYIELHLGYNESSRTRVHNNAGSSCYVKEGLQLNFDEDDDEEILYIFVRNQKVMGTAELARLEIPSSEIRDMLQRTVAKLNGMPPGFPVTQRWGDTGEFIERKLMPRGTIWLKLSPIIDHELEPGLMQDLTC